MTPPEERGEREVFASLCVHNEQAMCAECRARFLAPYPERTAQTHQSIELQPCGCQTVIETTPCAAHGPLTMTTYKGPAAFDALLVVAKAADELIALTSEGPIGETLRALDAAHPDWRTWA